MFLERDSPKRLPSFFTDTGIHDNKIRVINNSKCIRHVADASLA